MEQLSGELGGRIRALRKGRGLSLEQLSEKSGAALATLSRIENGKGSGTFRTHQRIAQALDVPLPELYRDLEQPELEAVAIHPESEEVETFTYDEKASSILLTKQVSSKQMLPQLIRLEPGGKTTLEQYRRGTERWLFGLEGTIEATVGEKKFQITKGGTLYVKASHPHQFHNVGSSTARLISVTSPAVL